MAHPLIYFNLTSQPTRTKMGLLNHPEAIRRRGELKCLKANGAELRGHRVYWRKDVDP
ncbi:hypothetical protein NEA10_15345 [Phormidium yuhuli AB48]|uniref:Uncharacterized protein n=1 Tax=Phormidium yuhuli AB48 TaxID=2940671 RepID=A0ABY5AM32_9CYAN|nr:hypothetical protein [Phormidium yuhuli]USR90212.1 hypothetical protein NEA10_15345 [Phormidium yuhuli AB48]